MPKHPKDAKDFTKNKRYVIVTGHRFEGKFKEYVTEHGITYAIFEEDSKTDHGKQSERKVDITNIIKIGLG